MLVEFNHHLNYNYSYKQRIEDKRLERNYNKYKKVNTNFKYICLLLSILIALVLWGCEYRNETTTPDTVTPKTRHLMEQQKTIII